MIRAVAIVACCGLLAWIQERDAEHLEQLIAEAAERRALRHDQLSFPIGCDATLTTSVSGITLTRGCYNFKEVYTAHEHP